MTSQGSGRSRRGTHTEDRQTINVLYCILDNRFGGPHRRALACAHRLRKHGVETLFLLGRKTDESWRPEGFESFSCRHAQCFTRRHPLVNLLRFACMLPGNLVRIRRLLRSRDIDIVHVDGVTNFVPALAARWAGVPIVWHYNDHLPGPLKWLLVPLVTRLASRVIVQGESLRESRTAGNRRLRDKTSVLYSAVDPDELVPGTNDAAQRARMRAQLGVPPDCLLIGTVGNLNRFKGCTYFLQVAAKIRSQVDCARFLVVGRKLSTDLPYWEELRRLTARLGLMESVVFAGFRDDVPRVLTALDVFVLASVLESCPLALLEAMAMKTPVVATDVGAVGEMVEHARTGFVVPPRDPDALAGAVLTVLARPQEQIRDMVEQARKTVERKFAVGTIAQQQLQVYESLCRSRVRHI